MMHNDIKPALLVRYLANESTKTENEKVERWINASAQNQQKFEEIEKIWRQSASRHDFKKNTFDADSDWEQLSNKIDRHPTSNNSSVRQSKSIDYNVTHNRFWPAFVRVAAIFLIAALIGIFAYRSWTPTENGSTEPTLRAITTAMGQRVNLTLSDGTKVLLNAGSTLRLPKVFETDKREVFLEGQAYFNVEENTERPFIIHSGDARTRVLGTTFSVRAYPEDSNITVAVEEGRVSFGAAEASGKEQVILNKNELGRFDAKSLNVESSAISDLALYLGWVDGYLKFKEAPLREVATELERRYGVEIIFADPQLKELSLTALLKSRSIQNVLDVIQMSLNIEYTLDKNQVVFFE
jgi:ferric-dicitrate binding protein FerR (iron transport regulator)